MQGFIMAKLHHFPIICNSRLAKWEGGFLVFKFLNIKKIIPQIFGCRKA